MITIPVDEGYAYDYLAILHVKSKKLVVENSTQNPTLQLLSQCSEHLILQLGGKLHSQICISPEFLELLLANEKTFDCVEKARYGEISAKEVDDANMERYRSKIKLQRKFFHSSLTMELKT
jgi:hypothetical protein